MIIRTYASRRSTAIGKVLVEIEHREISRQQLEAEHMVNELCGGHRRTVTVGSVTERDLVVWWLG